MVFRITNTLTGNVEEYADKDSVLLVLDSYLAVINSTQRNTTYTIQNLDFDNEELESINVTFPSGKTPDELLQGFGNITPQKEKKKLTSFAFKKKDSNPRPPKDLKISKESKPPIKDILKEEPLKEIDVTKVYPKQKKEKAIKGKSTFPKVLLSTFLPLLISIMALIFSIVNSPTEKVESKIDNEKIVRLERKVNTLEKIQKSSASLDLFNKYFISNLYSKNEGTLKEYVSKDITLDYPDTKLKSLFVKSVDYLGKNQYKINYLVVVEKDSQSEQFNVSYKVKQAKNLTHGFEVISTPKIKGE